MTTTTLKVTGMTCQHCVAAVKGALEGLDGVFAADVDLDAGTAVVDHDEAMAGTDGMVSAIEEEGYGASAA